MKDLTLLPTQRTELFEVIRRVGLRAEEFEWHEHKESDCVGEEFSMEEVNYSRLAHRPTGFFYLFRIDRGLFSGEYSPGERMRTEYSRGIRFAWDICVRDSVIPWLRRLKEQYETADPWAEVAKERALSEAAASDTTNEPFTPDEQAQVISAIGELQAHLTKTYELAGDRAEQVRRQLEYLEGASGRLGRKDWLNIAAATIISWGVQAILPPDAVRDALRFAAGVLSGIIEGLPPLVPS